MSSLDGFLEKAKGRISTCLDSLGNPQLVPGSQGLAVTSRGGIKFVCQPMPELSPAPVAQRHRGRVQLPRPMFASASLSSSDLTEPQDMEGLTQSLSIGGRGRRRGTVLTDPEEIEELREAIRNLSPEELAELKQLAQQRMLNTFKTEDGKPLYDEYVRMSKEMEAKERGVGEPTIRDLPRWEQDLLLRPEQLRLGQEKMQLRPWEEDEMELELMGNGNVFSPAPVFGMAFGGRRDFSFGLYANSKRVPELLGKDWAGIEQDEVVANPQFYRDILKWGPQMELTLMVMPSRDLPVSEAVSAIKPRMEETMSELEATDADRQSMGAFLGMFERPRIVSAPFLSDGPTLKKGTRLIFTCGNQGQIVTEAISPGKLKDQVTTWVDFMPNKKVTYSFFDAFIGDRSLDPHGKQSVGRGMSYIANGFSFQPTENINQVLVEDPNAPPHTQLQVESWRNHVEELRPSVHLFTFNGRRKDEMPNPERSLLHGIQRMKARQRGEEAPLSLGGSA
mmetsp:Transcript_11105/g.26345  ORF Transcript_11105/g.26345 Transcript_11105/m.26345 type:complete len:506 (-) Transcript_11105:14-1531(-)